MTTKAQAIDTSQIPLLNNLNSGLVSTRAP